MVGRDLGIWGKWRQSFPFPYEGFYFDVALGTPPAADPDVRAEVNRAWEFLLAKRIDAVGILPNSYHIIELRRGADQAAIGALTMYCFLWNQDPPDNKPCIPILVTDRLDTDPRNLAAASGIVFYETG
jgi:hypothetical protein